MFTKVNNKSPFQIKKEDLTKSASWNDVAQERFKKQHEDPENLPENDNHAVPKRTADPILTLPDNTELDSAVHNLEEQIKQLQQTEQQNKSQNNADMQSTQKPSTNPYDDWIK